MSKAAIPAVSTGNAPVDHALRALKQNVDQITGQAPRMRPFVPLPSDATLAQVIARLNEITERLQ